MLKALRKAVGKKLIMTAFQTVGSIGKSRFSTKQRSQKQFVKTCQLYSAIGSDTTSCQDYEDYEFVE